MSFFFTEIKYSAEKETWFPPDTELRQIPKSFFIPSKRGRELVLLDGWKYTIHIKNKNGSQFCCRQTKGCKSKLVLDSNRFILKFVPHIDACKPDFVANEIRKERARWCAEASFGTKSVRTIYDEGVARLKLNGISEDYIPPFSSVKSTLYDLYKAHRS